MERKAQLDLHLGEEVGKGRRVIGEGLCGLGRAVGDADEHVVPVGKRIVLPNAPLLQPAPERHLLTFERSGYLGGYKQVNYGLYFDFDGPKQAMATQTSSGHPENPNEPAHVP